MGDDDKRVFIPLDAKKLSRAQKRKALRIIILINKKRYGTSNGRMVANGSKHRIYTKRERT